MQGARLGIDVIEGLQDAVRGQLNSGFEISEVSEIDRAQMGERRSIRTERPTRVRRSVRDQTELRRPRRSAAHPNRRASERGELLTKPAIHQHSTNVIELGTEFVDADHRLDH